VDIGRPHEPKLADAPTKAINAYREAVTLDPQSDRRPYSAPGAVMLARRMRPRPRVSSTLVLQLHRARAIRRRAEVLYRRAAAAISPHLKLQIARLILDQVRSSSLTARR
jgi:hypothetical protein